MQPSRIEEVPVRWYLASDAFPFSFYWQTTTSPAGERIGLEETDMADRRVQQRRESVPASQREDAPASLVLGIAVPIERREPARLL